MSSAMRDTTATIAKEIVGHALTAMVFVSDHDFAKTRSDNPLPTSTFQSHKPSLYRAQSKRLRHRSRSGRRRDC